jgi:hypothetical protein
MIAASVVLLLHDHRERRLSVAESAVVMYTIILTLVAMVGQQSLQMRFTSDARAAGS